MTWGAAGTVTTQQIAANQTWESPVITAASGRMLINLRWQGKRSPSLNIKRTIGGLAVYAHDFALLSVRPESPGVWVGTTDVPLPVAVHDIKSDLTALLRGSEVIQETIDELVEFLGPEADPVTIEAIETINFFSGLNIKSSNNAFEVLDQRNKLHDLESKIEIAPCSVLDLLSALEAGFAGQAGEFRVQNECPANRAIQADYSLVLGVLKNIVRNGFIHNDSALKRVEVSVEPVASKSGNMVRGRSRITISDNGVGMPPEYLENWGQTMGKAAQLGTARGGSGTGLYSIRTIMNAHKGASIDITSAVGQGTTYVLEFNHVA